jgi:hypothetical protein
MQQQLKIKSKRRPDVSEIAIARMSVTEARINLRVLRMRSRLDWLNLSYIG